MIDHNFLYQRSMPIIVLGQHRQIHPLCKFASVEVAIPIPCRETMRAMSCPPPASRFLLSIVHQHSSWVLLFLLFNLVPSSLKVVGSLGQVETAVGVQPLVHTEQDPTALPISLHGRQTLSQFHSHAALRQWPLLWCGSSCCSFYRRLVCLKC